MSRASSKPDHGGDVTEVSEKSVARQWRKRAAELKRDTYAMCLAYKDPRVPRYARAVMAVIVIYALSPIDLIPDPIPFLGQLDDLVLIPLAVTWATRMIPPDVMDEYREKARVLDGKPVSRAGAVVMLFIWGLAVLWLARLILAWS